VVTRSSFFKKNVFSSFLLVLLTILLLPIFLYLGCNQGEGGGSVVSSPPPTSRRIFVTNSRRDQISVFDADAGGNVAPIRIIGSKTALFEPTSVFVDSKDDKIFAANSGNNSITVYGRMNEGDTGPLKTIAGQNTQLFEPHDIFVDIEKEEIFVANANDTITVYNLGSEGDVHPKRILGGQNSGLAGLIRIFVDTKNDELFALNFLNNTVTVYGRSDDGDKAPKRTLSIIEADSEGFQEVNVLMGIFVDTLNDELYISDASFPVGFSPVPLQRPLKSTITVYRRTDESDAHPLRAISGDNTQLFSPGDIFVDTDTDEIFAVNSFNNTVTVYDRNSKGDVAPLRTLSIPDLNHAGFRGFREMSSDIFIDLDNQEMVVANLNNTITIFGTKDKGDVLPKRIIGSNTGLLNPQWIYVDNVNEEIFVGNGFSRLITVHSIADEGNIAPSRTIPQGLLLPQGIFADTENDELFITSTSGTVGLISVLQRTGGTLLRSILGSNAGLTSPAGIYVDTDHDDIFVANLFNIIVYDSMAKGDVVPKRVIEGPNAGLFGAQGIFVDTVNDEILVTNSFNNMVAVYDRLAQGDEAPKRVIEGPNTALSSPQGIFVDTVNDEIFVTNSFGDTVAVYDRLARGDAMPLRIIQGPNTGLDGPFGIFVAETP
jgi:DNA-binding beta-propeller fold protein YncE